MKLEHRGRGLTAKRRAALDEFGFVIIDDFVGDPMLPALRDASRRVLARVNAVQGRQLSQVDSHGRRFTRTLLSTFCMANHL